MFSWTWHNSGTKSFADHCWWLFVSCQIDMLQAEVTALKTLVITSTPSSPNRELHPQLQSPTKTAFRKGHGRNKSTSSTGAITAAGQSAPQESVNSEFKEVGKCDWSVSSLRPREEAKYYLPCCVVCVMGKCSKARDIVEKSVLPYIYTTCFIAGSVKETFIDLFWLIPWFWLGCFDILNQSQGNKQ